MTANAYETKGKKFASYVMELSPKRPGALMTRECATVRFRKVLRKELGSADGVSKFLAYRAYWVELTRLEALETQRDVISDAPARGEDKHNLTYVEKRLKEMADARAELTTNEWAVLRNACEQLQEFRLACDNKDETIHEMHTKVDTLGDDIRKLRYDLDVASDALHEAYIERDNANHEMRGLEARNEFLEREIESLRTQARIDANTRAYEEAEG